MDDRTSPVVPLNLPESGDAGQKDSQIPAIGLFLRATARRLTYGRYNPTPSGDAHPLKTKNPLAELVRPGGDPESNPVGRWNVFPDKDLQLDVADGQTLR